MGLRPDWRVLVGGRDLTPDLRPHLSELRVETATGQTGDRLEIALVDEAGVLAIPSSGRALGVEMGYEGALVRMGDYVHVETELQLLPRRWTVRGSGADFHSSSIKARRTRSWDDTTLGGVVSAVAAEHGLRAAVQGQLADEAVAHIDQTAESDLHLLRRRARHYDAAAKVADGSIVFARGGRRGRLRRRRLRDPGASARPSGRSGLGTRLALGQVEVRRGAGELLGRVAGEARAREGRRRGAGVRPRGPAAGPRPAEADAAARLRALTRRTATLELALPGDPAVVAGGLVEMRGWGAPVDGDWVTSRASHRIGGPTGYVTELSAELRTP